MKEYKRRTVRGRKFGNKVNDSFRELYDLLQEFEDGIEDETLMKIPCVREVNTPMAKYEAVYINHRNLIQECLVSSIKEGWLVIEHYGNENCKVTAELKLKEN